MNTDLVRIEEEWVKGRQGHLSQFLESHHIDYFGIEVHSGFWNCHTRVRERIIGTILETWHKELGSVWITGHSLGGALATLLAFELSLKHHIPCVVYTFGSPRVGNKHFSLKFNCAVSECYRICTDGDLITGLPKWRYKHVGNHIVVDKLGNLIVNPSSFERRIMTSARRKFASHKMMYYRNAINAAVKVDKRLGLFLEAEAENEVMKGEEFLFKADRLSVTYGLASVLPVASLTGAVLVGDCVPKPLMDIPSVMFSVDDLTERSFLSEYGEESDSELFYEGQIV